MSTLKYYEEQTKKLIGDLERVTRRLLAYQTTINRIDDFFEYANESTKDREFIHRELDKLTNKLVKINQEKAEK
jgi:hypothetical protein